MTDPHPFEDLPPLAVPALDRRVATFPDGVRISYATPPLF